MLYGVVQCRGRNDEEKARTALRKIGRNPLFRRKLVEACQQAGYLQNIR